MSMQLSMPVHYGDDPIRTARLVVDYEKAGLDVVWVAEAYSYDAPTIMGYLAATTERVQIGSGILPFYSRTPTLIAMTAAGLDALSGGRAILGLGASGPQVIEGWHGVPYDRPVTRTREVIDICRQVWRRDVVTNDGIYPIPLPVGQGTGLGKPLKLINHPVRERIPIWVAALGDRNVELAAEQAEGWLPFLLVPEKVRDVWGPALDAGLARRDPGLGRLQMTGGGMLAVDPDMFAPARQLARGVSALYIGGMGARGRNFYNTVLQRYGWPDAAATVQDLYLDRRKDEAAAALPAEFIERSNLIGPPGFVQERIAALREAGVTHLHVNPVDTDAVKLLEQVKDWIT